VYGLNRRFDTLGVKRGLASAQSRSDTAHTVLVRSLSSLRAFPFFKGHVLTEEDLIMRKHILNIMCNHETNWENDDNQ
jgi:hypothetical protein